MTLLVRDGSLTETMLRYLIEQIQATENVEVRLRTTVVEAHGAERLEAISVLDTATGTKETLPTSALFILIGGEPHTQVLAGVLEQDGSGFILTGPDLSSGAGDRHRPKDWPLDRDPFWLESSVPGVLAAGDVRHGSVKRVAAGVGEGSSAVQFVHQHLRSTSSK